MSRCGRYGARRWITVLLGFATAFIAGAVFAVWVKHSGGWLHGTTWDAAVLDRVHRPLPRALDVVMLVVPWFGTNITFFAVFLPLWVWLWRQNRCGIVLELATVSVGNYLLNLFLKLAYERPRPALWEHRGEYTWSS